MDKKDEERLRRAHILYVQESAGKYSNFDQLMSRCSYPRKSGCDELDLK